MICNCSNGRRGRGFIERTLEDLSGAFDHSNTADAIARRDGFLQRLDPRAKVFGTLLLIFTAIASHRLTGILAMLGVAVLLAIFSKVPLRLLATRVWLTVFFFTGCIALPALFLTPGNPILQISGDWAITGNGLRGALRLVCRAEATATLALLLVLCTPWTHVLKALRIFRVPSILVVILGMTHRYIFLLLQLSRDMLEARRCRLVGPPDRSGQRLLAASGAGVLLGKSLDLSNEVFTAMQARGFRGEVVTLDDFRMKKTDWLALAGCVCIAAAAYAWGGR